MTVVVAHGRRHETGTLVLLRVSRRAWDDLGASTPHRLNRDARELQRYPILQKFWDRYSKPENIDKGEPLRVVTHPGIFRLRAGGVRAATWYDHSSGVVWLMRALSIADFHDEDDCYERFRTLEASNQLLPTEPEIVVARGLQYVVEMRAALKRAVIEARDRSGQWIDAEVTRPMGEVAPVGRVCHVIDGELSTRYLILPRRHRHPADAPLPPTWLETVVAASLADDEPVVSAFYSLPNGSGFRPDEEFALQQERLESATA